MKRRTLILVEGHWLNGLLFVEAARRLGLHPVTLSADPTRYKYLAANNLETIRVDTDNLDALIGECSRLRADHDIAGITAPEEEFYATVGKLCRLFDLPGPNSSSIERCCDKFAQRQLLAEAGIPIPAYRLAANAVEVGNFAAEIGLPVVVKPATGTGSNGVRLCRDAEELTEHTTNLLGGEYKWTSSPRILVEEFVQGPFYSVDLIENQVIGICTSEFDRLPHFVFRGCTYPAPLTDDEHRRIADVSLSCLQALGLDWGPAAVEVRWSRHGPIVIEVNPRLAGGTVPRLVKLAYGIDPISELIKLAIGDECDLRKRYLRAAAARNLIPERNGVLNWIKGDTDATSISGVAEVEVYVEPRTPILRKFHDLDRMGHVLAASPSPAQTEAILRCAVDSITWSITPFSTLGPQEEADPSHSSAPNS
ncbi:ATP-grasp domain-containing protein